MKVFFIIIKILINLCIDLMGHDSKRITKLGQDLFGKESMLKNQIMDHDPFN